MTTLYHKETDRNTFFFITTFTLKAFMIKNIVMKHWHMLTSDPTLSQEFKDPPYSRLVQASLNMGAKQTLLMPLRDGNYPCGNCAQCNNTKKNSEF
ncbi:unnamed protein product [Coregonus sp. 'balchen']|nr:unnamed protein product [Coregonus sp. 'balchen']